MTQSDTRPRKPLGGPAYGSIPHLPSSENGGDKTITQGQADIILDEPRDEKDNIIATLKYDGSCTAVAKINGEIVPLMRAGYPAKESNFKQHKLFHEWVFKKHDKLNRFLNDGERIAGEWMLQAHGTKYDVSAEASLWRPFDLFIDGERQAYEALQSRVWLEHLTAPAVTVPTGDIDRDLDILKRRNREPKPETEHEGIVYRVEREGEVDFMAKWVRDKRDGKYLPGVDGSVTDEPVWNYPPDQI